MCACVYGGMWAHCVSMWAHCVSMWECGYMCVAMWTSLFAGKAASLLASGALLGLPSLQPETKDACVYACMHACKAYSLQMCVCVHEFVLDACPLVMAGM